MEIPVLVKASEIRPGDRLVAVDEGMWHSREVHKVSRGTILTTSGHKYPAAATDSVMVLRAVDVGDPVDLSGEIEDPRDRDDLRQAERARARCERYGLDEAHPEYWTVYHRDPQWRERIAAYGIPVSEEDA